MTDSTFQIPAPVRLTAAGRAALTAWEQSQPRDFYTTDHHLRHQLEMFWGTEQLLRHEPRLVAFGECVATTVDQAVRRANLAENLPRLDRFTVSGDRTEEVLHSLDHHLAGRAIYGAGVISVYGEPGHNLLALALHYLSSYNGEAGHNCPVACTAGVVKILQQAAGEDLRAKYLPRLLEEDYAVRWHGAQFLTEVQGGSDVGLNDCTATLVDEQEDLWAINGEKWFCSNVTADLALITARPVGAPEGTRGLGLFLVPRRLDDGSLNGLYLQRLKEKLGTKSMATAEVEFRDALAYRVGEPGRGFQQAMDHVINTSRLYNAVGSAGAARRAYVLAWTYARHRQAFGAAIANFPLTQSVLAEMRCEAMALTSGSLYLAHLRDLIETGEADERGNRFFRFVVNLNKYRTSIAATEVVRRGIEVLGGNGAMENFSPLPRLLRDAVIYEAWEGAHNTLIAQAVRDCRRHRLHEAYGEHLHQTWSALENEGLKARGLAKLDELLSEIEGLAGLDEQSAGVFFRPLAERLMYLFYVARLAREAEWEARKGKELGKSAVIEWLWHHRLEPAPLLARLDMLRLNAEVSSVM